MVGNTQQVEFHTGKALPDRSLGNTISVMDLKRLTLAWFLMLPSTQGTSARAVGANSQGFAAARYKEAVEVHLDNPSGSTCCRNSG